MNALPPGSICLEASAFSGSRYLPCAKPATTLVVNRSDPKAYPMCEACAYHTVKNRGGRYVEEGEDMGVYTLDEITRSNEPRDDSFDDVEADPEIPDAVKLASISALASSLVFLRGELAELEAAAEKKREAISALEEKDLPVAMMAVGMTDFGMAGGRRIEIETSYQASIPTATRVKDDEQRTRLLEQRGAWFSWLRGNGHGSIIKKTVEAVFPKGKEEDAEKLAASIRTNYANVKVTTAEGVHHSTLIAFVKEQAGQGTEFPAQLGVVVMHKAKLIEPKKELF